MPQIHTFKVFPILPDSGFTLGTLSAMMACDRFMDRKNPWFDLFAVDRKRFHGGTWRYIKKNFDYPYYLLRDHLKGAEEGSLSEIKIGEGKILKIDGKKWRPIAMNRARFISSPPFAPI